MLHDMSVDYSVLPLVIRDLSPDDFADLVAIWNAGNS